MAVPRGQVKGRMVPSAATSVNTTSQSLKSDSPTAVNDSPNQGMIGARLRARRLEHGISLRQFARDLEVSASFISQLETGKAQPSVATLFSICSALGISSDELYDGASVAGVSNSATDAGSNSLINAAAPGSIPDVPGAHSNGGTMSSSPVVRPENRKILVLDSGVTWESLTAFHREHTNFLFARYDVGGSSTIEGRLIRHVGTEYGFVLSGILEVTLGFETYRLASGHSISFDSTRPHRLTNVGDVPVEAIWFNLEIFDDSHP